MRIDLFSKQKIGCILRFFVFTLLLFLFLNICQKILVPKKGSNVESKFSEWYNLGAKGVDVQVITLGSSHIAWAFSPIVFYKKHKIISYNLGVEQSSIFMDFSILKEALKTQKIKIVIVDIGALFKVDKEKLFSINYTIDEFPLSKNKITVAHNLAELEVNVEIAKGNFNGTFWGALFPLYRYHNRWKKLNLDYFNKTSDINKDDFSLGYWRLPQISSSFDTEDSINLYVKNAKDFEPKYTAEFDEESLIYFKEIVNLCHKNGIALLPVKFPVNAHPSWYHNAWTYEKYKKVKALCEKMNLTFLDLKYDLSVPIDWRYDSCDKGKHLNDLGAYKATEVLGDYLVANYDLQPQKNDWYDYCASVYDKVAYASDLELTHSLVDYAEKLNSRYKDSTILFACRDDMMGGFLEEERTALHSLGLQTNFNREYYRNSYIAVIKNGIVEYENVQKPKQEYKFELDDGRKVEITSSGWFTGSVASIKIDGTEECVNRRGINIVVIDNDSGLVVDSVAFDTCNPNNPDPIHNSGKIFAYYKAYKTWVLKQEGRR